MHKAYFKQKMITKLCNFNVIDNTGAYFAKFIGTPGFFKKKSVQIGDIVTCSIVSCTSFNKKKNVKVIKGEIFNFLIVQQKKKFPRLDGSFISADINAVVIINKKNIPRGSRIIRPIPKELRRKFIKVVSIAYYVF
jgi:large subunit ribosomal protein L14